MKRRLFSRSHPKLTQEQPLQAAGRKVVEIRYNGDKKAAYTIITITN